MNATATTPSRSHEQRIAALELANEVRFANANIARTIRRMPAEQGRYHAARLLERPTRTLSAMPVGRLLLNIKGVGVTKAAYMIRYVGAHTLDRRIGELTERQREQLAWLLREAAWRRYDR